MTVLGQPQVNEGARQLSPQDYARLCRADEHIFSTAVEDATARLGRANLQYGMAKIHWVQEQLGLAPEAAFLSAPDFTVTRNTTRWLGGFGYGGSLRWGDGNQELMILDLKPNACGMVVGGLKQRPTTDRLLRRLDEIKRKAVEIDGVAIEWDFGKGNHYIDLFKVRPQVDLGLPPYAFIMHFAGSELRRDTPSGAGLYWDKSPRLQASMQVFESPFGPLRVLLGAEAREYYSFYQKVDSFIKKRRLYAAEALFGEFTLINNDAHQGLSHMNEILLGCYRFFDEDRLYPIGLRADLPAYLVRGRHNLSPEAVETLGFGARARNLGAYDWLLNANLLPHGGGYRFPQITDVAKVHHLNGSRYFEVELAASVARQILTEVRNLPFEYRGESVLNRTLELGMAEVVAQLIPETVFKV